MSKPLVISEPILSEGFVLTHRLRGRHGHTVGNVDADTIAKVRAILAIDPHTSKRNALKQVIGTSDVNFDAKYQTLVRALRKA